MNTNKIENDTDMVKHLCMTIQNYLHDKFSLDEGEEKIKTIFIICSNVLSFISLVQIKNPHRKEFSRWILRTFQKQLKSSLENSISELKLTEKKVGDMLSRSGNENIH